MCSCLPVSHPYARTPLAVQVKHCCPLYLQPHIACRSSLHASSCRHSSCPHATNTVSAQVTSCAPLFVEVKPDASYSAICSGDAAVCKGFQTSVSSGDLHLELSDTPQTSTATSIVVTLPAAQLNKVVDLEDCMRGLVLIFVRLPAAQLIRCCPDVV